MINPRMRMVAVAGSMALTLSLAVAPVAMAQDDPTFPVHEVLTSFAAGRFSDATEPFCASMEAEALGGLGQIGAFGSVGAGYDLESLFGALAIDTSGLDVSVLEENTDDALVGIEGSVEVGFDEDGIVSFVAAMMSTEDAPMDEETVEAMLPLVLPQIEAMLGGAVTIDQDVRVIREDGVWQVCDDLSALGDALAGALDGTGGQDDPSDDPDGVEVVEDGE
jgi:hypothetical protein